MSKHTPNSKFNFRLHHVRPRFKSNVENVLGYMSFAIAEQGARDTESFNDSMRKAIKEFEDNSLKTDKTVENWRTEIVALFALVQERDGISHGTLIATELANSLDLQLFFKRFISTFQYPGGHLKPQEIQKLVGEAVCFHPGRWIARYFCAEGPCTESHYISAEEFCHCVLNDLRVTRDHEQISKTKARILQNRISKVKYDLGGDVIRYAKDILDYMILAGLLKVDLLGRYKMVFKAKDFLEALAQSKHFFDQYISGLNLKAIHALKVDWIDYVNNTAMTIESISFTDSQNSQQALEPSEEPRPMIGNTKSIGDYGEGLALVHEKAYLDNNERSDISHLVKLIPSHLAIGYDINSREVDDSSRYIEVKTTLSKSPLVLNRFHMTTNEWVVAEAHGTRYFIYRIQVTDESTKLFIMNDPVGLYKSSAIKMVPRDGADISYADNVVEEVELLK